MTRMSFSLAERRDPGDVVRVQRDDAALALHQLHHDGAGVLVGGLFQRGKVARGHVVKISREGAEVVVEHVLAGGGQGRQCAAMEGVDQRDDLIPALAIGIYAVFAGALDRALVGLGARVGKEGLPNLLIRSRGTKSSCRGLIAGGNGIGKHARTIYVVVSKLGQQRRDLSALLNVEVIGDMHELFGLCLERREHSRVAMT